MTYFVKTHTGHETRDNNPDHPEKPVTGFEPRDFKNPVRENNPGLNAVTKGTPENSEISGILPLEIPEAPGIPGENPPETSEVPGGAPENPGKGVGHA